MLERCFKRTKTPFGLISIQKALRYNTSQKLLESVPYTVSRRGGPDAAKDCAGGGSTFSVLATAPDLEPWVGVIYHRDIIVKCAHCILGCLG